MFTILLAVVVLYICYKIGVKALMLFLLLAAVLGGYFFFSAGGAINVKTPDNIPKIPGSLTAPIHS